MVELGISVHESVGVEWHGRVIFDIYLHHPESLLRPGTSMIHDADMTIERIVFGCIRVSLRDTRHDEYEEEKYQKETLHEDTMSRSEKYREKYECDGDHREERIYSKKRQQPESCRKCPEDAPSGRDGREVSDAWATFLEVSECETDGVWRDDTEEDARRSEEQEWGEYRPDTDIASYGMEDDEEWVLGEECESGYDPSIEEKIRQSRTTWSTIRDLTTEIVAQREACQYHADDARPDEGRCTVVWSEEACTHDLKSQDNKSCKKYDYFERIWFFHS